MVINVNKLNSMVSARKHQPMNHRHYIYLYAFMPLIMVYLRLFHSSWWNFFHNSFSNSINLSLPFCPFLTSFSRYSSPKSASIASNYAVLKLIPLTLSILMKPSSYNFRSKQYSASNIYFWKMCASFVKVDNFISSYISKLWRNCYWLFLSLQD